MLLILGEQKITCNWFFISTKMTIIYSFEFICIL